MSKATNGAYAAPEPPPAADPPPAAASPELKARIDRYGEILAKAFDLAEAGLSLGLTVIGAVGAAAQKKILESRADGAGEPSVGVPPDPPPKEKPAASDDAGTAWGITNRLPIVPGAPVAVSFSINNDSPLAPRPVSLAVEAFVGEQSGATLPPGALTVSPATTTIAPMDFEKFVLHGAIAPETPPDVYLGTVRVGDDGGMRIPVRLVVEPGGRA